MTIMKTIKNVIYYLKYIRVSDMANLWKNCMWKTWRIEFQEKVSRKGPTSVSTII